MRNRLRVLAFDLLAPARGVAALVYIGIALAWPLWWVSVCSVLCLLIVQGVLVNGVLFRRDGVTVGTDDDGPGLRLAVVAVATAALVAAVVVGYPQWTGPDRALHRDSAEVVGIASSAAEASATFSPQSPTTSRDRVVGDDDAARRRQLPHRIRLHGKGFGEQEPVSFSEHRVCRGGGHRPERRGRRGDHARHPERARQAAGRGGTPVAGTR